MRSLGINKFLVSGYHPKIIYFSLKFFFLDRMTLQESRDTGQKEMDNLKVEVTKGINDMNRRINEGKQQHDTLTKEVLQNRNNINKISH